MIPLIQKSEGYQIVRDKICTILAAEFAHQVELATAANISTTPWAVHIYRERFNPWEVFAADPTPLINVWYDGGRMDDASSNQGTRQKWSSRYNLDVYAYVVSTETSTGHTPGDEGSALEAQRIGMLVRNILMHGDNKKLQLSDPVPWKRSIVDVQTFQPNSQGRPVENVYGLRLSFEVDHNETVPIAVEEPGEGVDVRFYFEPDGMVVAELKYDYPEEGE